MQKNSLQNTAIRYFNFLKKILNITLIRQGLDIFDNDTHFKTKYIKLKIVYIF